MIEDVNDIRSSSTFDVDGLRIGDSLSHLVGSHALIDAVIGLLDATNDERVFGGKEVRVLLRLDDLALKNVTGGDFHLQNKINKTMKAIQSCPLV